MNYSLEDLVLLNAEHFIAINKPANLVVNRSKTVKSITIQDLVLKSNILNLSKNINESKYIKDLKTIYSEFLSRGGIVHRLDKDTSGVLLIAKDVFGFYVLKKQFLKRKVKKIYHAVVWGDFIKFLGEKDYVLVNLPIARNPKNRKKFAIVGSGRDALTKVFPQNPLGKKNLNFVGTLEDNKFSFIKAVPKTGRTHQIRVHLKALNHEILGDSIYQGRQQQRFSKKYNFNLMLHAYSLRFKLLDKLFKIKADYPEEFTKNVQKINWSLQK